MILTRGNRSIRRLSLGGPPFPSRTRTSLHVGIRVSTTRRRHAYGAARGLVAGGDRRPHPPQAFHARQLASWLIAAVHDARTPDGDGRRPGAARTRPLRRPGDANFIQCDETKGNANHTWTDSRVRRRDRRAFTHATRRGTSRLRPPITPRVIQSVHLVRTCTPWEQSCTDYGGWARMQHAACMIAHGRAYQMAAWRSQPHP